jgi:hypothetical protein
VGWHHYITKEQSRAAIALVCNAIFRVRHPALWGEGTTACASDSKNFGAWDQGTMEDEEGVVSAENFVYGRAFQGTHLFQCCIHPWMHFQVNVK